MSKKIIYLVIFILIISGIYLYNYFNTKTIENDVNNIENVIIYEEPKIKIEEKIPASFSGNIPIFMYHFVDDNVGANPYPENVVKISTLESQLKYLKENNYEVLTFSDLDKLYKYTKPVMLTFDDGFADFYYNAFPLFKKYNFKATLFVVDGFLTKAGYANIDMLIEMRDSGLVDIQCHTMTHPHLSKIKLEVATSEIINSKNILSKKLNKEMDVFCYPYGDSNKTIREIVSKNYTYGLDMQGGVYNTKKHDKFNIPRIYANRSMTMNTYINYLNKAKVEVVW